MTFRTRLLTSLLVVVVAPLVVLAVMIPREMEARLTTEYRARVTALTGAIRDRLADEGDRIESSLRGIARGLRDDNEVRAAIVNDQASRGPLHDFGELSVLRSGLTMLQIQDESGRILSSGHFRNEFGRIDPTFPAALGTFGGTTVLVAVRTAQSPMLALARLDTVRVGARTLTVIGGVASGATYLGDLAYGPNLSVAFSLPDSVSGVNVPGLPSDTAQIRRVVDSIPIPYVDATSDTARIGTARLLVSHDTHELDELLRDVRRWLMGVAGISLALALFAALWLSGRLSRPIDRLATEASHVDLDRLDARFSGTERGDEIGVLARGLSAMLGRLRASASRLREAERRATVGEVARQINHDIKNGLSPIRNVVRHLAQVAREAPNELPSVFVDRQKTLESSIEYLDSLSRNYARLSPRLDVAPCDVGAVIEEVVQSARARSSSVRASVQPALPPVIADSAVLRRILENLVGNAIDALEEPARGAARPDRPLEVVVGAEPAGGDRGMRMVRVTVADTGRGMTERELAKAFDDFYTTKPGGTGLGLSVVRRLVADLAGALRVETEPGRGTRVTVDIPAAVRTEPTDRRGNSTPAAGSSAPTGQTSRRSTPTSSGGR